jgi:hyperosmotically inducible periplasmic protein
MSLASKETCMMRRGLAYGVLTIALAAGPITSACGGGGGGSAAKPVSATLDDATITTRVKTVLLNDPNVGAQQIDVNASDGVVTLSGVVKSQPEVDRAVELARKVGGVKDVKTSLEVKP